MTTRRCTMHNAQDLSSLTYTSHHSPIHTYGYHKQYRVSQKNDISYLKGETKKKLPKLAQQYLLNLFSYKHDRQLGHNSFDNLDQ